ncbi:hypothetical protein ES705_34319 [subsurface metagenome]
MAEEKSKLRTFRIIVLSLGTLLAIFFLLAFVPKLISMIMGTSPELPSGRQWEGNVMTAMFFIFMIGYAIGWWHLIWGGVIIILSAFLVSLPFIIIQGNYGALIFGIPQLVIGILYILLDKMEKRKSIL